MKESEEFAFHTDAVQEFNNDLFSNIFTEENIVSRKKAITVKGNQYYGFFLEKGKESFFIMDELYKDLPFKVLETDEVDYKGDVFKLITDYHPITIPAEKKLEFRELVDKTPAFRHSNELHFLLYKIIGMASYIDRVNYRVATEPGFGKDSIVNIIAQLVNSTANLYGATFAKLEFNLINKLIVLNEMGNLKKDDLINMQEFLLASGGYFSTYNKRTRKTNHTKEQYDISKLSLVIFYNLPEYYTNKAQEYFDQMFTEQVINRFIPFVFDGYITSNFGQVLDTTKIKEENENFYKDVIATLNYYRKNIPREIEYNIDSDYFKFSEKLNRYSRTFYTLLKYISLYAKDQEEFDILSHELYDCYKKYKNLTVKEKKEKVLK